MTRRPISMEGVTLAILAGSAAGGGLFGLWLLAIGASGTHDITLQGLLAGAVMAALAFVYSSAIWGVGIVLLGGPARLALHLLKLTSPLAAIITGGVLALAGAAAIFGPVVGTSVFLFLPAGAIVGWIVQRVAYPPITPPQTPPS